MNHHQFSDITGDGQKELIFGNQRKGEMAYFKFTGEKWERTVIAGDNAPGSHRFSHGLGVGDVNGDGRSDVLVKEGWWENSGNGKENWLFHRTDFFPDCAQIYVYDVDRDGDQDVLASSAHHYGIWWSEQVKSADTTIWKRHTIFNHFSQAHGLALADIDDDGNPDLVTGKRYFAHNGKDPGGNEPAVLYVFFLRYDADNEPYWLPYQIDTASGVGLQVLVDDIDMDGMNDIITGNKKGVFVFLNK